MQPFSHINNLKWLQANERCVSSTSIYSIKFQANRIELQRNLPNSEEKSHNWESSISKN